MQITRLKLLYQVFFTLILATMFSCAKTDMHEQKLLSQAQKLAETKPKEALLYLDSIKEPQLLDRDLYMQYLVVRSQVDFLNGDLTDGETLLPVAVDYFKKTDNTQQLALAYFYGGNAFIIQQRSDKALDYYLHAAVLFQELGDEMLEARSLYNIGNTYYKNQVYDSTIVYYEKALPIFHNIKAKDKELITLATLSANYLSKNKIKEAREYGEKALALAKEIKVSEPYSLNAMQNLGLVDFEEGKYDDALVKYHSIRDKYKKDIDIIRIDLCLARLHRKTNNLDSVHYYSDEIIKRLLAVKDPFLLQELFSTLSLNYEAEGDLEKANFFKQKAQRTQDIVDAQNESDQLNAVNKAFMLNYYKREAPKQSTLFLYIGLMILLAILLFVVLAAKYRKKKKLIDDEIKRIKNQSKNI